MSNSAIALSSEHLKVYTPMALNQRRLALSQKNAQDLSVKFEKSSGSKVFEFSLTMICHQFSIKTKLAQLEVIEPDGQNSTFFIPMVSFSNILLALGIPQINDESSEDYYLVVSDFVLQLLFNKLFNCKFSLVSLNIIDSIQLDALFASKNESVSQAESENKFLDKVDIKIKFEGTLIANLRYSGKQIQNLIQTQAPTQQLINLKVPYYLEVGRCILTQAEVDSMQPGQYIACKPVVPTQIILNPPLSLDLDNIVLYQQLPAIQLNSFFRINKKLAKLVNYNAPVFINLNTGMASGYIISLESQFFFKF